MIAIIDAKMPGEAKAKLSEYAEIVQLASQDLTFFYLSGHPDIFFCNVKNKLIYAPNTPVSVINRLREKGIFLLSGRTNVGKQFPAYSAYNAIATDKFFLHNLKATDSAVTECLSDKITKIGVKQSLTRCSTIYLSDGLWLTSDKGIHRILQQNGQESHLLTTESILLPGQKYGLPGGCMGFANSKLFICGSLNKYKDGKLLTEILLKHKICYIELYDGPLFDCGSILFAETDFMQK